MSNDNKNIGEGKSGLQPIEKNYLKFILALGLIFFVLYIFLGNSKPNACDCAVILDIPTEKVGLRSFPIQNLGDEGYKKFADCQDAYAGPATAILECNY